MFRPLFLLAASSLLIPGCAPVAPPSSAEQVRPPPPRPRASDYFTAAEIQRNAEQKISEVLGAEALRDAQTAATSIVAVSYQGRFDSGGPRVTAAVRGPLGWSAWKSGRPAPLAAAVGGELDRLLADRAFWSEDPFYPDMDCPDAGATMMVIRHKGQVRVTRQGCSPEGLTGRLEETVLSERVSS